MSDSQIVYKPTVSAMLPSAGLFLPETLHRRDGSIPGDTETESTRLKYFQRKTGRPKYEAREAEKSSVSISDLGSPEDLDAFPSIATAFQFAHFVSSSNKPSSESHGLAILLHRVRQDVSEAHRLYLSAAVSNFLDAWPDRKSWIDSILVDIRRAMNDIGQYIEAFRVAGDDGGTTSLKRRFEWISGHQKRLSTKQQLLSTCHSSLVTAINIMQTVELCGVTNGSWQDPIYEAPVQPWVKNDDTNLLRGPYSRREWRMSHKNLSASNIHLTDSEQDTMDTRSVNSVPVELPGSTPEDLSINKSAERLTSPLVRNSYRRSSQRRTYFERKTENAVAQTIMDASSSYSISSLPDTLQYRPSSDHVTTRKSLDQFPSTGLAGSDASKVSLDSARPHSHPGRARGATMPGAVPRTSTDFVAPLPTVDEKTVERNGSTTSTTAVVAVSQLARRYHPNHVYIRRQQPSKHRSLPSELPHLQSQSRLTDDLADWMLPPSAQSENLKSSGWPETPTMASPTTSIASCPAQTQTAKASKETLLPKEHDEQDGGVDLEPKNSSLHVEKLDRPEDDNSNTRRPRILKSPDPVQGSPIDRDCAASIRSHSSSIMRKPIPTTARLHSSISTTTLATSSNTSLPHEKDTSLSTLSPSLESTSRPLLSHIASSVDDAELSILQQRMLSQTYVDAFNTSVVNTPTSNTPIDSTPTGSPPTAPEETYQTTHQAQTPQEPNSEIPCTPPQDKEVVPDLAGPAVQVKPMSAQAKRRAAHQRRMEVAFGKGVENMS